MLDLYYEEDEPKIDDSKVLDFINKVEVKRNIIFPTRLNLEKLSKSQSVDEAISNAKKDNIITVTPTIERDKSGSFLTIPKDAGYGEIKEPLNEITTPGASVLPSKKQNN